MHTYIHRYIHTHAHIHTRTRTHTHTHTHVLIYITIYSTLDIMTANSWLYIDKEFQFNLDQHIFLCVVRKFLVPDTWGQKGRILEASACRHWQYAVRLYFTVLQTQLVCPNNNNDNDNNKHTVSCLYILYSISNALSVNRPLFNATKF
jgi:hypothetical protein